MIDDVSIDRRLATLERVVADLQLRFAAAPASSNWLDKVTGSISDEPAFIEALAYGRALRIADHPREEASEER